MTKLTDSEMHELGLMVATRIWENRCQKMTDEEIKEGMKETEKLIDAYLDIPIKKADK